MLIKNDRNTNTSRQLVVNMLQPSVKQTCFSVYRVKFHFAQIRFLIRRPLSLLQLSFLLYFTVYLRNLYTDRSNNFKKFGKSCSTHKIKLYVFIRN